MRKDLKLALSATGTVFGDIGTSPLYALGVMAVVLGSVGATDKRILFGFLSLLLWTVILIVSVKYISLIMKVNSGGEGGIAAQLSTLIRAGLSHRDRAFVIVVAIMGISLFIGDSLITPAISILSAVEGLKTAAPELSAFILPIVTVLVVGLFLIQRWGVGKIGQLFGPVMLVWFVTIGVFGLLKTAGAPEVYLALLPTTAIGFVIHHPVLAFFACGTIVLAITGAEALYADMGQFGRKPISYAWHLLILPALVFCYLGQLAVLIENPNISAPFFALFPASLQLPAVILAAAATFIASQSVIAGTFSLVSQAMRLGLLPRIAVTHTSRQVQGQIYIRLINTVMLVVVLALIFIFRSSENLAGAYGLAVSGALVCDALLYIVVLRTVQKRNVIFSALFALTILPIDMIFFISSLAKIPQGGWVPLVLALTNSAIITIWFREHKRASNLRKKQSETIDELTNYVHEYKNHILREEGTTVYIGHHEGYVPSAMLHQLKSARALSQQIVILYVTTTKHAHLDAARRFEVLNHHYDDGIIEVRLSYGYMDKQHIVHDLADLHKFDRELKKFDPDTASFIVSSIRVEPSRRGFRDFTKNIYALLSNASADDATHYKLPLENTQEIVSFVRLS